MFERRLKIVLLVLVLLSLVLFGRVFGMQVFGHTYWVKQSAGLLTRPQVTETTRGRIYDFKNRLLAQDTACTDACVDYRAIVDPPDPVWVRKVAIERLSKRTAGDKKLVGQKRLIAIADEEKSVRTQVQLMWATLAALYQPTGDDPNADRAKAMTDLRRGIVQTVETRRQSQVSRDRDLGKVKSKSSALMKWIFADDNPEAANAADGVVIKEQQQPHVVLHALDSDACNFLGKRAEDFPGLVLQPSTHRQYPMHTTAAHVMGRMSRVSAADMAVAKGQDPDDLRRYLPNDMIGREGVEALCEPLLRGARGKIEMQVSDKSVIENTPFQPGADVHLSIDADLQAKVQEMLQHVEIKIDDKYVTPPGGVSMHASAVVLDVKTNEVRVLASNPGFDVNDLETRYVALVGDTLNEPLRDRATSDEFEPGSTVKPMMGLGAITQGTIRLDQTIECTGYLYLPEVGPTGQTRLRKMPHGSCWIVSEYKPELKALGLDGSHHPFPRSAPHPTGFLTFADALERSCDIYFETVADRLGPQGVNHWYDQFGLGRITGIGIYERPGLRSGEWKGMLPDPRMNNCYSGMGQGTAWATPLQIANAAATIARGGVWMRPRLITSGTQAALDAVHERSPNSPPDQVDLHLNAEAIRQTKIGMKNVVDGPAGTGHINHPAWLSVAAKTGTADTSPLAPIKLKDASGQTVVRKLVPVIRDQPETDTPWYRSATGKSEVIAWYMGFAPVDDPQIAFCVMVEYPGAGGGPAAGPIASKILDACIAGGYFHAPATITAMVAR